MFIHRDNGTIRPVKIRNKPPSSIDSRRLSVAVARPSSPPPPPPVKRHSTGKIILLYSIYISTVFGHRYYSLTVEITCRGNPNRHDDIKIVILTDNNSR